MSTPDRCARGRRYQRLVDRAFVRELSVAHSEELRTHLEGCASCRQRWNRLAVIDRQLGGPHLGDMARSRIGEALIDASSSRSPRHRWRWLAAGTAVATAAIVVLLLWPVPAEHLEFQARGSGHATTGRTPGMRVFCVASDVDDVTHEIHMSSSSFVPTLRCTIDDALQLAYSTPDREGLTMVAFSRLDSTTMIHAPITGSVTMPLVGDRIDSLVGWSTRLAAAHQPGTYELVVRFFDGAVPLHTAITGVFGSMHELRGTLQITAGSDAR